MGLRGIDGEWKLAWGEWEEGGGRRRWVGETVEVSTSEWNWSGDKKKNAQRCLDDVEDEGVGGSLTCRPN